MKTIVHYSVMSIVINIDRWDHEHHKTEMNGSCHIDDSIGLIRMTDSFRGKLTAITRRIIGLSTHEPLTCSITHTHSVTHSPCLYSSLSPTISGQPLPRPLLRPSHQRLIWTLHLSSFQDYFEGMNLPSSRRQTRKRQRQEQQSHPRIACCTRIW